MQSFNPVTKDFPTTSLTSAGTGNGISAGKHLPRINKEFCDDGGQPLPTLNYYDENQVGQTIIGNDDLDTQIEKQDVAAYSVEDTVIQSQQNYKQKMTVSLDIVIDADLSLHAGDLIFCEFPELSTKKTTTGSKDRKSGIYMIADLCHYVEVCNSFTGLHLVREAYGVKSSSS